MGERSRSGDSEDEEPESSPPAKRSKQKDEQHLEKLVSLLEERDSLIAGLTYFLKGTSDGGAVSGGDLVSRYLGLYPRCDHLTRPLEWDRDKRTLDVLLLCFKCLELVLLFTSAPPTSATPTSAKLYHTIGHRLVQRILANHMRSIYHSLLSTQPMKLVHSCLRLLATMVMQGPDSAKQMQLVFNFSYKPLQVFFGKTTPISDPHTGNVESVRQSLMKFALSFLIIGDSTVISAVLQLKGFLSSFFKLLPKDDVPTISLFLVTLADKVVANSLLSKKPKSLFFNQFALKQVASLLNLQPTSNSDEDSTGRVRDIARGMLVTLCTDMELGVCYKAKDVPGGLEKTNNPVLLHFLLYLSGRLSDPFSQDIIFRTLSSCPDLFITYIRSLGMNFEPQTTSKWTMDMGFLIKVYDRFLALPRILSDGKKITHRHHLPVSLVGVAVDLTTPRPVTRTYLSLGLQHPVPLVKYHTLRLIGVVLHRASAVVDQWGPLHRSHKTMSSFLVKYCNSVLKRLPDARTFISLRQRLLQQRDQQEERRGKEGSDDGMAGLILEDRVKNADLAQGPILLVMVLEVLCGLQRLSPDLFQQVQFRPAKLLPSFLSSGVGEEVCLALQVNINAFEESLVQNRDAVLSVIWLTQSSDAKVSKLSIALLHKVLNEAHPMLCPDTAVLVASLSAATSSHPDQVEGFVKMVSNAVSAAIAHRYRLRAEVARVLGMAQECEQVSLQDILDAPDSNEGLDELGSGGKHEGTDDLTVLVSSVLAEYLRCENAFLLPFINHLLSRLSLTSDPDTTHQLTALTRHYLPNTELQFSLKPLAPLLDPTAKEVPFATKPHRSFLQLTSPEALLKLIEQHSCTGLVRTTCELLEERIADSGITLTSSLTSPSSGCGLVAASKLLTRSLLTSDPATEKVSECDKNFHSETDSVPSCSSDPRAVMLACLESPGKSTDQQLPLPPLLISKDCAFRLSGPEDLQIKARCILQTLARLSSKASKKLNRHCKEWLSKSATDDQLDLASMVAMESKDEELSCLVVAKSLKMLTRNIHFADFMLYDGELIAGITRIVKGNPSSLRDISSYLGAEDWNKFLFAYLKLGFDQYGCWLLSLLLPVVYQCASKGHTPLGVVYDMIWSHSEFISTLSSSYYAYNVKGKESLVELLITVVELCPSVCKSSHILAFLGAYSATQRKSDRGLLYLMAKYEESEVPAGEFSPFLWGEAALEQYRLRQGMYRRPPDISDVLKLLDTRTLLKTTSSFSPQLKLEPCNPFLEGQHQCWGSIRQEDMTPAEKSASQLYDPCFLLPLLSHHLEPGAHMDCRAFVGHGCLAFLFIALSSLQSEVRMAAGHALTRFKVHFEESKFREKPQIALLMEVLQNSILEGMPRLPSVWTSFAAKASLLYLHADSVVYSVVSHFTVHKPAFKLRDVPLLFTMLHSSSAEGAEEQLWLLKVLVDGLKCKEDCRLYEKHKVFSHVTALAGSAILEQRAKDLAKELLRRAIKVSQGHIIRTTG